MKKIQLSFDEMKNVAAQFKAAHGDEAWLACVYDPEGQELEYPEELDDAIKALDPKDGTLLVSAHRATVVANVRAFASTARAQLAGTNDPVKIGTYAQRASFARHIVDGTATVAMLAVAKSEAVRVGLAPEIDSADATAMAAIWIGKDERLAALAAEMDATETGIIAAINAAETIAAIDATVDAAMQQAQARIAQVLDG